MGCCLSSNSKSPPPPPTALPTSGTHGNRYDFEPPKFLKSAAESRAPPPDFDEETVKEVLSSETPNPKPPPPHRPPPPHYSALPPPPNPVPAATVNPEAEEPIVPEKKEIRGSAVEKLVREEEISEQDASEVCSVSVSVTMSESAMSTATTANDEEVTKKGGNRRSPAGKVSATGRINRAYSTADSGPRKDQRVVGRSPTRRSDRSPMKRNCGGGGRMVHQQSWESGPNPVARRPLRPDQSRRDPGDSSGRRSRSPAPHRSTSAAVSGSGAGSRNGSVKRVNQSPGRVRKDPPEPSPASEAAKPGNGSLSKSNLHHRNNDNEEDATAANESLENPLVSLECFIFL